MGNQQSSTSIINDTVNKSVANVLMSSSNKCSQNNSLSQVQVFKNISGDKGCSPMFSSEQTSQQSPNFTCSSDSKNDSELQTKFRNELTQQADAQAKNFVIGNAETRANTTNKIVNDILANVNISSVSGCVQDNIVEQSSTLDGIKVSCPPHCSDPSLCIAFAEAGHPELCDYDACKVPVADFAQRAVQSSVASCLSKNSSLQKAISDTVIDTAQIAKAKNTGIDLAEIVNSLISGPILAAGLVFIIALMILAYFLLSGGGETLQKLQMMDNNQ